MPVRARVAALFLLLCLSATGPTALAADSPSERSLRDSCLNLNQVRRTEILDDETILFHMRNRGIKKVSLAFGCPSLKFYGSFSYKVFSNRLCARVDSIVTRSGSHCPIADIEDYEAPEAVEKNGKDDGD